MEKSVIIIEDNIHLLEAYKYYFDSIIGFTLKDSYNSVEEALSCYENIYPEIIISDISLPGISGIEGIEKFKKLDPSVKIIIISIHDELSIILDSIKNYADGYLTKPVNKLDIQNALNSLNFGGAPLSDNVSRKLLDSFQNKKLNMFSERENEIIKFLMKGHTYSDIAEKIFVSHSTVNYHIQNIYVKLNANSKSEALKKINELFSNKTK